MFEMREKVFRGLFLQVSQVVFLFSMLLLALLSLDSFFLLFNGALSKSLQWLLAFDGIVWALFFIVSGAGILFVNRAAIYREEKALEAKKSGKKNSGELARSPLLKAISNWISNEKKPYAFLLISLFILALFLRLWDLTILDPYTDEYSHLLAARDLLTDGHTKYTRSIWLSVFVAISQWLGNASSFYEYVFWGRLPSVVFGALAVFPLYFVVKRFSKPIALISVLLWATSPWAIGISRAIREYAFYPFAVLCLMLLFFHLMELLANFKRAHAKRVVAYVLAMSLFVYYGFFWDPLSTLKLSFIIFPIVFIWSLISHKDIYLRLLKKQVILRWLLAVGLIVFIGLASWVALTSNQVVFDPAGIDLQWVRFFMKPMGAPMNWLNGTDFIYLVYVISAIGAAYAAMTKKREYFLHLTIFIAFLLFFLFFFNRYIRQRYASLLLIFFDIIIATGVYGIFVIFKSISKGLASKRVFSVCGVVSLLIIFGLFKNTLHPLTSDDHKYVLSTNEHHDRVREAIEFLDYERRDEDVYIATVFTSVLKLAFDVDSEKIYGYKHKDKNRFELVKRVMKENKQGFMILDWRQNGRWAKGFPREDFLLGEQPVKLLFDEHGIQIYRWKHLSFVDNNS